MQTRTKVNSSRRGRPPAYDRDRALAAIVETFRRRGFAATTLDELSAATSMNRPSLRAAFGDKKAMYLTAVERYRRDLIEVVSAPAEQTRALGDTMVTFFDAAIGFYCAGSSPGCLVLCTATAEAVADDDIRAALAGVLAEIEGRIADRVGRAARGGSVLPDAAGVVTLLSAVLVAIAIQARAGVPEPELRALARSAVGAALPSTS